MNMLLSIIVPAYNCAPYLSECLHSILDQLPEDCELIVVDDGSTDETPIILKALAGTQPNLQISFCAHTGVSGARNTGLSLASGRYAAFLDCDDRLRPGILKTVRPQLEAEADLYIFGIERIFLNGGHEDWTLEDRTYSDVSDFADEYIRTRRQLLYSICNKFYRRSIIEKLTLRFDENITFGEDRLFNFRYLSECRRIITSGQMLYQYIQRSADSLSAAYVPDYFGKILALHEAKVQCFSALSKGTTLEERRAFAAKDIASEVITTVRRFPDHPKEEAENLPHVNALVFGSSPDGELEKRLQDAGVAEPGAWYRTECGQQIVRASLRAHGS